jgi:dUTP pyrophosphatase
MKVKKLHPNAVIPKRAHPSDAGLDLVSIEQVEIPPLKRAVIRTGIAIELPSNSAGLIWPRSGIAAKFGINVLAGVVDASFRGGIGVVLHNTDPYETYTVNAGDKVAQLLVQQVMLVDCVEVENLGDTARGDGGFGSTGQ